MVIEAGMSIGVPQSFTVPFSPAMTSPMPASLIIAFARALGRLVPMGMYVMPIASSMTVATTDSIDLSRQTPTTCDTREHDEVD
jgi:hypothetical protein